MSTPVRTLRATTLRMLALSAAFAIFALMAGATSATAAPLQLQWTQTNVYDTSVAKVNQTWLGYLTRSGVGPQYSNGTASAADGAVGPSAGNGSPTGPNAVYVWSFASTAGTIGGSSSTPASLTGTLDFGGTLAYDSTPHSIHIKISNPRIVLKGDGTGELIASGTGIEPNPMAPGYDPGDPNYLTYSNLKIFDLDLTKATVGQSYGGATVVSGIVPALAAPKFFTGSYAVGAGPDRTPPTFGTLSIVIPAPEVVPQVVEPTAKHKTFKVKSKKKSLFRTKSSVAVRVTLNKKTVGYATVRGKKVRVTYFTTTFEKGKYRLTPLVKKYKSISVRLG